jgi:putative transposase
MIKQPWITFIALLAGMIDKQNRLAIACLKEENQILRERRGNGRLLLNDDQRRRLAVKAKPLGRETLTEITELFSPDTILGWFRKLVAKKYDGSCNRHGGRPKVCKEVIDLAVRFKKSNPRWAYDKICDYIVYLGFKVSKSTVKRILLDHGLNPEPQHRKSTEWDEFIRSHAHIMAATDFFSIELFIRGKLVRYFVLFAIELGSRKVEIQGIRQDPHGEWMKQVARNLTDSESGFLKDKRYLIHDQDPLFTNEFKRILKSAGVIPLKTSVAAPDMNAYAERFVWSVKHECLNKMILTSSEQLDYVLTQYLEHYHYERIHQGIGRIIQPKYGGNKGEIIYIERLGGLLKSYHLAAA